ncbi:MAG: DUF3631 domain-containing protein [Proteobacteria bacterium]|jgi:putative DNA primase/helicase|nr:DUF3631 domain-containing protein [Pseudomonadota bacterium]
MDEQDPYSKSVGLDAVPTQLLLVADPECTSAAPVEVGDAHGGRLKEPDREQNGDEATKGCPERPTRDDADNLDAGSDIFAPLSAITTYSPTDAVQAALDRFASELLKTHGVTRTIARDRAVHVLRRQGFGTPAQILDNAVFDYASTAFTERFRASTDPNDDEVPREPVDGAQLLDDIATAIRSYVVISDEGADAAALWVLHAHTLNAFSISPILVIRSAAKRCGKTTALSVLGELVPHPLTTSNITAAALFRIVDAEQPTLLIDEADTFLSGEDMRGILNSGHNRKGAVIVRCSGKANEPTKYSTWAAKAIALIGDLRYDTLRDRSITIELRRKLANESVTRFRADHVAHLEEISCKAVDWSDQNRAPLRDAEPVVPAVLNPRAADNWSPLLAIADCVGGAWPLKARLAAIRLIDPEEDDGSLNDLLLADICEILRGYDEDRIRSAELVGRLVALEGQPWSEIQHGRSLSTYGLASRLKTYRIRPKSIRFGDWTAKGYELSQFEDAFKRYVGRSGATVDGTVTAAQPLNEAAPSVFDVGTGAPHVPDDDDAAPLQEAACAGVPTAVDKEDGDDDLQLIPNQTARD